MKWIRKKKREFFFTEKWNSTTGARWGCQDNDMMPEGCVGCRVGGLGSKYEFNRAEEVTNVAPVHAAFEWSPKVNIWRREKSLRKTKEENAGKIRGGGKEKLWKSGKALWAGASEKGGSRLSINNVRRVDGLGNIMNPSKDEKKAFNFVVVFSDPWTLVHCSWKGPRVDKRILRVAFSIFYVKKKNAILIRFSSGEGMSWIRCVFLLFQLQFQVQQ